LEKVMGKRLLYSVAAVALLAVSTAGARDMRSTAVRSVLFNPPPAEESRGAIQQVAAQVAPPAQEFVDKAGVSGMFEIE
jgi:hypothetical protein